MKLRSCRYVVRSQVKLPKKSFSRARRQWREFLWLAACAFATFHAGAQSCDLYPIALPATSLTNAVAGTTVIDVFNGVQPGSFGWLAWAGSPSEPALATSLTPPGNSASYINPNDPADHQLSLGDWVSSKPGVSNSKKVRDVLEALKQLDITLPVWSETRGQGE